MVAYSCYLMYLELIGSNVYSQNISKMDQKSKKKKESLEDIIFLFVVYVCTDILCLAVTTFVGNDERKTFDIVKLWLEKSGSKLSKGLNSSTVIVKFVLVRWKASDKIIVQDLPSINVHNEVFIEDASGNNETKTTKIDSDSKYLLVSVILLYMQYTSKTWTRTVYNTASVLDIRTPGLHHHLLANIDLTTTNFHSVGFAEVPDMKEPILLSHDSLTETEHVILDYRNVSPLPAQDKNGSMVTKVLLSNVTDVNYLELSAKVHPSSLLLEAVVVSMLLLSPIVLGKSSRVQRSAQYVKSLIVELQGSPNTGYCVVMAFGKPGEQQEFCMLVDTGSANLAIAANYFPGIEHYYSPETWSSSLEHTGQTAAVQYTVGQWSGDLVTDYVRMGGSPSVRAQFTMITSSNDFFVSGAQWSGILGLAYDSLAKPGPSVQSYWSILQESSGIPDLFALSLCPHIDFIDQGGVMEFGGVSGSLYTGPLHYTAIVQELYYNILVTNLSVGEIPIKMHCSQFNNDKAIVDSGTTDIYLPVSVFEAVIAAFSKHIQDNVPLEVPAEFWRGESKISWPTESKHLLFEAFPILYIGFGYHDDPNKEFSLAVTSQVYLRQVPGSLEEQQAAGCFPLCDFFVFGVRPRSKGLIIGGNVLLGFTTVFDREAGRIGFAKSTCNYADNTYGHVPFITGPHNRDPVDCVCHGCSVAYWEVIVYTCGSIVFLIGVLTILTKLYFKIKHREAICGGTRCKTNYKFCCAGKCCRGNRVAADSEQLESLVSIETSTGTRSTVDSGIYDMYNTDLASYKESDDSYCELDSSVQESEDGDSDKQYFVAAKQLFVGDKMVAAQNKLSITRAPNIYHPASSHKFTSLPLLLI